LKSDAWLEKRDEVLRRDRYACRCGRRADDVHHKTYDRIFNEEMDDLVSICRGCHELEHGLRDKPLPSYDLGEKARRLRNPPTIRFPKIDERFLMKPRSLKEQARMRRIQYPRID
jgi:hypothetical protein